MNDVSRLTRADVFPAYAGSRRFPSRQPAHDPRSQRRGKAARGTSRYGRFTEGFETPDLRAAKALLDALPA